MKLVNRHIAKTFSWRLVGTIDTIILSWFITGNIEAGMQIGLADVIIKMILYYIHERFWFKLPIAQSNKRHILKTVTWRIIGTSSTIILAIWIWGDSFQSLQIGGAETITKSLLYYFHEKFWYRLQFGLDNKRQKRRDSVQ